MKNNETNENRISNFSTVAAACVASCRKLIGQLQKTKTAIVAEFRGRFGASEPLLRLAMNEAEALAWETGYPYLVFPALATEKAQAVASWQARQQAIRRGDASFAFAA